MKPNTDIHTQARHIAELLHAAIRSDSQAPTVLSAELGDTLREIGWTSTEDIDALSDERDSLASKIERFASRIETLRSELESD